MTIDRIIQAKWRTGWDITLRIFAESGDEDEANSAVCRICDDTVAAHIVACHNERAELVAALEEAVPWIGVHPTTDEKLNQALCVRSTVDAALARAKETK